MQSHQPSDQAHQADYLPASAAALDDGSLDDQPHSAVTQRNGTRINLDLKSIRAAINRVEAEAKATLAAESRARAEARARAIAEDQSNSDAIAAEAARNGARASQEAIALSREKLAS